MPKKLTQEQAIERFKAVHGDRYDYSLVEYVNSNTKVKIICSEHGVFEQKPNSHMSGHGCDKCGGTASLNTQSIIDRFKAIHANKYDYSLVKYVNRKVKIKIVCPAHGVFEQTPNDHVEGFGCCRCKADVCAERLTLSLEQVLTNFRKKHGSKFDYSAIKEYRGNKEKLEIICPEHGSFWQSANMHLRSEICCLKCNQLNPSKRNDYVKICDKYDGMSHLYVVKCVLESESFYKVGVARLGAKDRYKDRNKDRMPYSVEIIYQEKFTAATAWDLEKKIHKRLKCFHYKPLKPFKGAVNECFTEYILPSQL